MKNNNIWGEPIEDPTLSKHYKRRWKLEILKHILQEAGEKIIQANIAEDVNFNITTKDFEITGFKAEFKKESK